jgi:hypothetical protein
MDPDDQQRVDPSPLFIVAGLAGAEQPAGQPDDDAVDERGVPGRQPALDIAEPPPGRVVDGDRFPGRRVVRFAAELNRLARDRLVVLEPVAGERRKQRATELEPPTGIRGPTLVGRDRLYRVLPEGSGPELARTS